MLRQKRMAVKSHEGTRVNSEKDLPVYPSLDYFLRTPLPRFASQLRQYTYDTSEFRLIGCRYLNRQFFQYAVPHIHDHIAHYRLETLVYCTSNINLDMCKEFYVNLRPIDITGNHFISTVAGRRIDFTPDLIRSFLGLRSSSNPFICFPEITEIYGSFAHESIDSIHKYYFNSPRKSSRLRFDVTKLSVDQYVWYRLVIDCILPIASNGRSMIGISHMLMMFALEVSLDIDIALNIHHSIIYHSQPVNGKIYMPYCHIITAFLASQGIDTTMGTIRCLSKDNDQIGPRHLKIAGIIYEDGGLRWIRSDDSVENNDVEHKNFSGEEQFNNLKETITDVEVQGKKTLEEICALRQEVTKVAKMQNDLLEQQREVLKMINLLHKTFRTPEWSTSSSDDDSW